MTDYTANLDDEIEICSHCGGRAQRLGPEQVWCGIGRWRTLSDV